MEQRLGVRPAARRLPGVSRPGDAAEREADQLAAQVMSRPANWNGQLLPAQGPLPMIPGGAPLPPGLRGEMEARFGHDFSRVRVHADHGSALAAKAAGARAFTYGSEIFFGEGVHPHGAAGEHLLAHELVHTLQPSEGGVRSIHRQAAPATATPQTAAGSDYQTFLQYVAALEMAAYAAGFSLTQRVSAFRNIYYATAGSGSYTQSVLGTPWALLIPGAANVRFPPIWYSTALHPLVIWLRQHQELSINGQVVDVGHLLAGLDARNHPTSISLLGISRMRSNVEATTWLGDIGSVVVEYIHGSTASFRDTAMVRRSELDSYYDGAHAQTSTQDMRGNADAYGLTLDPNKTLADNIRDYYAAQTGGVNQRWTALATGIGLGTWSGSRFSGDTPALRTALQEQVFNAALAYAATRYRGDVLLVMDDPGPGIFAPTWWECYWNVSGWVVEILIDRVGARVASGTP